MQRAYRMFLIAAIFLMTLTPSVAFASSGLEDAIINLGTDLFGADAVAGTSGGLVGPAFFVLSVICYILGLVIMFQSLVRLSRASQFSGGFSPTQSLYAGPLVGFIIAGALIGLPDTWRAFNETIFTGTGATNILAYDGVAFASVAGVPIPGSFDLFMTVLVLLVQFIGWIAFVRGLLMIKRAAEGSGQASYGTAITHIFGGVLAANLIATVDMIQQTLCRSACIVNI